MEIISFSGRGPNTTYTIKEGDRTFRIEGTDNLPDGLFRKWRNRQAAICMRRNRQAGGVQQEQQDVEQQHELQAEGNASKETKEAGTMTDESEGEKALKMITCKICLDQQVQRLVVPCGDLAVCADCLNGATDKQRTCPMCRTEIKDHFGVNLS